MAEHDDTLDAPGGMDRRTLIKRGAIAGGALVWATPVVSSIGLPTAAGTTEPENGNGPFPPADTDISFIVFSAVCPDEEHVRVKVEIDDKHPGGWDCEVGSDFNVPDPCPDDVEGDTHNGCPVEDVEIDPVTGAVTIFLEDDCEFDGEAFKKCGQCCYKDIPSGDSYTFATCPHNQPECVGGFEKED